MNIFLSFIAVELELYSEQKSSKLAFRETPGEMNLLKITFLLIYPLQYFHLKCT